MENITYFPIIYIMLNNKKPIGKVKKMRFQEPVKEKIRQIVRNFTTVRI